jgi:arginine/serine-rich splicing factor 2
MRSAGPNGIEKLTSIRVSNVDPNTTVDRIEKMFSKYGKIGDLFRPTDLGRKIPREFIFIRYINSNDADNAISEMNGVIVDDREIVVKKAIQDSYFTQDTGFITNEALDHPKIETTYFDPTMPATHHIEKRKKEIEEVDVTFGIRIDDIHHDITVEELKSIFASFGKYCSILIFIL